MFSRSLALAFRSASLLAAPLLVAAAPAPGLDQVEQHLKAVTSMTADFSQEDRNGHVLNGTLTLKQPGKIRFQYQKGVPQLIVADGRAFYFIDYQVRQVQRWPIGSSPLRVLLDPSRMASYATVKPTADPRIVSVEVYDTKRPEYGRITMVFQKDSASPAGLKLQGWVALDAQNNRTTIRLSNQRFNVAVADSSFRWNDPRPQGRTH